MWADGLPNVSIVRRPAEIHAALCWLGREVARRNEVTYMTVAEARELATSGTVSLLPSGMPGARHATVETAAVAAIDSGPGLRGATAPAAPGPLPVSGS